MLTSSLSSSMHVFATCVLLAISSSGVRVELQILSDIDEQTSTEGADAKHQDLTESTNTTQTDANETRVSSFRNASHRVVPLNTVCSVVPGTQLAVPEELVADLTTSGYETTVQFIDTKKAEVCLRATFSISKLTSKLDQLGVLANGKKAFKGVFAEMSATKQILPMLHKILYDNGVKTMAALDAAELGSPNGCTINLQRYKTGYIAAYYATLLWFARKGKAFYQDIYGDAYRYTENHDECNTLAGELFSSGLSEMANAVMDDLRNKRCGPNDAQTKYKEFVNAAQQFVKESSVHKEMFIHSDGDLNFPHLCQDFIVDISRASMCS